MAPRTVYVSVHTLPAKRDLDAVRRQMPFAMSVALNDVAKLAQAEQVKGIFERFKIKPRARARIRTTVQLTRSSKGRLEAKLTERDPWLVQHEQGETRKPGDIYSSIVQPVSPRAKRIGVLRGTNTPKAILAKPSGFVLRMKTGKVGVFRRKGKGRLPIELVFALEREANLPRLLKFGATVGGVVEHEWERAFGAALDRAMSTALPTGTPTR